MTMTEGSVPARLSMRTGVLIALSLALTVLVSPIRANDEITFTRDIAPILHRSCLQCHRPDAVAPMSLISYAQVRPWARSIKKRTALRDRPGVMPPWYIERDIGIQQFKDDPSLSEEEIENIAIWADSGAPLGNPADLPPPLDFGDENTWAIGVPEDTAGAVLFLVSNESSFIIGQDIFADGGVMAMEIG